MQPLGARSVICKDLLRLSAAAGVAGKASETGPQLMLAHVKAVDASQALKTLQEERDRDKRAKKKERKQRKQVWRPLDGFRFSSIPASAQMACAGAQECKAGSRQLSGP